MCHEVIIRAHHRGHEGEHTYTPLSHSLSQRAQLVSQSSLTPERGARRVGWGIGVVGGEGGFGAGPRSCWTLVLPAHLIGVYFFVSPYLQPHHVTS